MAQVNLIQNIAPKKIEISPKAGSENIANTKEDSFEEHFHNNLLGVKERSEIATDETEKKDIPVNTKPQKSSYNNNDEEMSANILLSNLLGMNQPVPDQTAAASANNQMMPLPAEATSSSALVDIPANNANLSDSTQSGEILNLSDKNNETNKLKMQAYILPVEQDVKLSEDIIAPLTDIKNTGTDISLTGSDDTSNLISSDLSFVMKEGIGEKDADLDNLSINNKTDLPLPHNISDIKNDLNIAKANIDDISLKNDLNKAENVFDKVVVNQVLKGVDGTLGKGVNEIKIALFPPDLGTIHIKVSMEGDKINAMMFTDNNTTKNIMESNLKDLKDAIIRQGLAVDQFTVTVGDGGWGQRFYDDRRDMEKIFYAGDNNNSENETLSSISGINNISGYYKVLRGDQMIDLFA